MKTKSATKNPVKVADRAPIAIPVAIRPKGKGIPKQAGKGVHGVYAKLAGMGSKLAKKSTVKDKDRPVLRLSDEANRQFGLVAPAKNILDTVTAYLKTERANLDALIIPEFLHIMWESRTQPQNPRLEARDGGELMASAIFSLVRKWRIQEVTAEQGESPDETFVRTLVEVIGLDQQKAEDFVHTELDFMPEISIPITDLEKGDNEVAKEAVRKLSAFLANEDPETGEEISVLDLDEDERASLIVIKAEVKVLDGFLDRLCGYCQDEDQLVAILTTLIKPEFHMKSCTAFPDLPLEEQISKLCRECGKILKTAKEKKNGNNDN